jgi:hypothetical protein
MPGRPHETDIDALMRAAREAAERVRPRHPPRPGHVWQLQLTLEGTSEKPVVHGRWVEVPVA